MKDRITFSVRAGGGYQMYIHSLPGAIDDYAANLTDEETVDMANALLSILGMKNRVLTKKEYYVS